MNEKYLKTIAKAEEKDIEQLQYTGATTPKQLIASAILFCLLEDIFSINEIALAICEPYELVKEVYDNLTAAGYIYNNKIVFNIEDLNNAQEWKREYYMFSMAGLGVIKKV